MNETSNPTTNHRWRVFRSGGFDQVAIETAADLQHLGELDQKLWSVLNCPTTDLEFDPDTLALLDTDGDGYIRAPEVLAAVDWTCARLADPGCLFSPGSLTVAEITAAAPAGATLQATAQRVLDYLGRTGDQPITVADFADTTRLFAPAWPNGDGVVPAALANDPALIAAIETIIDIQGSTPDRSGAPGITEVLVADFFTAAQAHLDWLQQAHAAADTIMVLGEQTARAATALSRVEAEVEDWFARCRLAAFDTRAAVALGPDPDIYATLGPRLADQDPAIVALPLATVSPAGLLPLGAGLNPAWVDAMAGLQSDVILPLLGPRNSLTEAEWRQLREQLAPFRDWQAARPETAAARLPIEQLNTLVAGDTRARLEALIAWDRDADTSAVNLAELEKLVRLRRDLVTLLRNFVNLRDFYDPNRLAIFQAGTLYLDQRSCALVLRVADAGRHATLAPYSGCYLIYCTCERGDSAPIQIVAALTNGEVDDRLVPGRNGVFYDRAGRDWKATITRIVEQPVSLRQAFWSPYRRFGRFIENQIRTFAAGRDKAAETGLQSGLDNLATRTTTAATNAAPPGTASGSASAGMSPAAGPLPAAGATSTGGTSPAKTTASTPPPPFDIARFAGIFAAFGLAAGALGTALTATVSGLVALAWWQIPLATLGVLVAISGPPMLLAWLTLRRRNLGPLLDANGWAVNTRARINIAFGEAMTQVARLPGNATRAGVDPFADRRRRWPWIAGALAVAAAAAAFLWWQGYLPLPARS